MKEYLNFWYPQLDLSLAQLSRSLFHILLTNINKGLEKYILRKI